MWTTSRRLDKVERTVRLPEGRPRMSRWPILFERQPLLEGVTGVKVNTGWSFWGRIQLKRIVPVWPRVLYKQGKPLILPATVCTYRVLHEEHNNSVLNDIKTKREEKRKRVEKRKNERKTVLSFFHFASNTSTRWYEYDTLLFY